MDSNNRAMETPSKSPSDTPKASNFIRDIIVGDLESNKYRRTRADPLSS